MQNRYAGDVGDFIKLGLLRHLARPVHAGGAGVRVGVNWYLTPDEAHNSDGKHVSYADPANKWHASLSSCDPNLMRLMTLVLAGQRLVSRLEDVGSLAPGTITFRAAVPSNGTDRGRWHLEALDRLGDADLVFVDPDNGFRDVPPRSKAEKFALVDELRGYAQGGQALIAYHHADRSARLHDQAKSRLEQLSAAVDQQPVATIIGHRGSSRFFVVTAPSSSATEITDSLSKIADAWSPHVSRVHI